MVYQTETWIFLFPNFGSKQKEDYLVVRWQTQIIFRNVKKTLYKFVKK